MDISHGRDGSGGKHMVQRNYNLPIQIILDSKDDLSDREKVEGVVRDFLTNMSKAYHKGQVQVKSDPNNDTRTLRLGLWRKDAYSVDFVEICVDKDYNVLSAVQSVSVGL